MASDPVCCVAASTFCWRSAWASATFAWKAVNWFHTSTHRSATPATAATLKAVPNVPPASPPSERTEPSTFEPPSAVQAADAADMSLPAAKAAPWYTAPATAPGGLGRGPDGRPATGLRPQRPEATPERAAERRQQEDEVAELGADAREVLDDGPGRHGHGVLDLAEGVGERAAVGDGGLDGVGAVGDERDVVVDGEAALADGGREVGAGALAEEGDGVGGGVGAGLDGLERCAEGLAMSSAGTPSFASLPRAMRMPPMTSSVLTPSRSHLPMSAAARVEVVAELAQRCPELDHQAHQLVDPDAGRLGRAEDLVERDLLVLGCHRPVAEEADDVARAVDEVELRDAGELDGPLGQALEVVAGEPEPGVEGGHDRGRASRCPRAPARRRARSWPPGPSSASPVAPVPTRMASTAAL